MQASNQNEKRVNFSTALIKETLNNQQGSFKGHYIDQASLSIFVEKDEKNSTDERAKRDSKNNQKYGTSSSECDNEENLDKMSTTAIGDDNAKKNRGECDFMTPKKKGKNCLEISSGINEFNSKLRYEKETHSANRTKSKNQAISKSFSSLVGLPNLGRKQSDPMTLFNDDCSEKNLLRELNCLGLSLIHI